MLHLFPAGVKDVSCNYCSTAIWVARFLSALQVAEMMGWLRLLVLGFVGGISIASNCYLCCDRSRIGVAGSSDVFLCRDRSRTVVAVCFPNR